MQHSRALSGHLQNVDRLLQLQRCRLRCMEEGYRAQLEELQEEFETERYRGGGGGVEGGWWWHPLRIVGPQHIAARGGVGVGKGCRSPPAQPPCRGGA